MATSIVLNSIVIVTDLATWQPGSLCLLAGLSHPLSFPLWQQVCTSCTCLTVNIQPQQYPDRKAGPVPTWQATSCCYSSIGDGNQIIASQRRGATISSMMFSHRLLTEQFTNCSSVLCSTPGISGSEPGSTHGGHCTSCYPSSSSNHCPASLHQQQLNLCVSSSVVHSPTYLRVLETWHRLACQNLNACPLFIQAGCCKALCSLHERASTPFELPAALPFNLLDPYGPHVRANK